MSSLNRSMSPKALERLVPPLEDHGVLELAAVKQVVEEIADPQVLLHDGLGKARLGRPEPEEGRPRRIGVPDDFKHGAPP